MYCLDTCICIDFLRGKTPEFYRLLRATDPRLIKVPAVVAGELLVGAKKSRDPRKATLAVEEFLSPFEVLPFTSDCAYEYAELRADLELRGLTIGSNDMLIAATALASHAVLITNNMREFKRIGRLSLECWDAIDLDDAVSSTR